MGALADFVKSDMSPESVSVGGALRAEAANAFIDAVRDQSGLLKQTTLRRMMKLSADLSVLDIMSRILVRVTEGVEPSSGQKANPVNEGKTLQALPVQLFFTILFSTLSDNQDVPDFEGQLAAMFAKKFSSELEDLGINGTADTGASFLTLNKGWVQLAKDYAGTGIGDSRAVNVQTLSDDYVGKLEAVMAAQDDRFDAESTLILSSKDHRGLVVDLGAEPGGVGFVVSGKVDGLLGKPIWVSPFLSPGTVLYTPLPNLVWGINRDIERYREVRGTKRCIDYTFNIACDFEIAVNRACVVGYNMD